MYCSVFTSTTTHNRRFSCPSGHGIFFQRDQATEWVDFLSSIPLRKKERTAALHGFFAFRPHAKLWHRSSDTSSAHQDACRGDKRVVPFAALTLGHNHNDYLLWKPCSIPDPRLHSLYITFNFFRIVVIILLNFQTWEKAGMELIRYHTNGPSDFQPVRLPLQSTA